MGSLKRLGLALSLLPGLAWAAPSDRQQPIYIEADQAELDDSQGVSIYEGDVRYRQGTIRLRADRVTIYTNDQREVQQLVAVGEPATYKEQLESGEQLRAEARQIEYQTGPARLFLEGQAHLWQGDNEMSGEHIQYNANTQTVEARRATDGDDRVRVIIQPQEDQQGETGNLP